MSAPKYAVAYDYSSAGIAFIPFGDLFDPRLHKSVPINVAAAAPDLLEALRLVLDSVGALCNFSEFFTSLNLTKEQADFVVAALAKAEGREP